MVREEIERVARGAQ
ncbi:hypothetical protein [Mesorhizobium sp.]